MIPKLKPTPELQPCYKDFVQAVKGTPFEGDLQTDYATRLSLATDNSIYQVIPQAVAFPKTSQDIAILLQLAQDEEFHDVRFSPRGGGTGTNGQSLSSGILIDTSRYMNRILETNIEEGWVKVQPGVILDQLNAHLKKDNYFFAVSISPSDRATLGGMVSTDACGKGSVKYGRTSEHILALDCILSDGSTFHSQPMHKDNWDAYKTQSSHIAKAMSVVDKVIFTHQKEIDKQLPKLDRFVSGYNLTHLYDAKLKKFNLNYLIAGAEGTLAFVTEIKLKIIPLLQHKALFAIAYNDFLHALGAANLLLSVKPTAIETVDDKVLGLAKEDEIYFEIKDIIGEKTLTQAQALNLVELQASTKTTLNQQIKALKDALDKDKTNLIDFTQTQEEAEINALWRMRKKSVGLLGNLSGNRKPIPFIEDTVVPPSNLAAYIKELRVLLDQHNLVYGMFGHVDVGCLHVRPALDMTNPLDARLVEEISTATKAIVKKYGGMFWAEHGKGYRTEFTIDFFGDILYGALREIKTAFDPYNKLNPGKIVTSLKQDLKPVKIKGPYRGKWDRQIPTHVRKQFPGALSCNGNAACMNYDADTVICPSMMVTKNRIHSPKGRTVMMREWLRQLASKGFEHTHEVRAKKRHFFTRIKNTFNKPKSQEDLTEQVLDAMSGCLGCKACASSCPLKVNVPEFKANFLALYYTRYLRPARDYLIASMEKGAWLMSWNPKLAQSVFKNEWLNKQLQKWLNLNDPPLPEGHLRQALKAREIPKFDIRQINSLTEEAKKFSVCLVQDVFTSYYDPKILLATYDLLTALGYNVYLLPFRESGKAKHAMGFLNNFKKLAKNNAKYYKKISELGIPLVGIEPSTTLSYRDEYKTVLSEREQFNVQLLQEWLLNQEASLLHALKEKTNLTDTQSDQTYYLFNHCTEKSLVNEAPKQWQTIFGYFNLNLTLVPTGCCGMAGSYGHQEEHFSKSKALYQMSWQKKLKDNPNIQTTMLATGFSCREQVKRFDQFKPEHPILALKAAILR